MNVVDPDRRFFEKVESVCDEYVNDILNFVDVGVAIFFLDVRKYDFLKLTNHIYEVDGFDDGW